MRIVIYKDNLSTGRGADHLACAIADSLAERGHAVTLVSNPTSDSPLFVTASGVTRSVVAKTDLRDFVARGYDVCIAAGSNEICDLTRNGRECSPLPTVTMMLVAPQGFFKWKHPLRNRNIKRAFNRSDALQVLCRAYIPDIRRFAPRPGIEIIGEWPDCRIPERLPERRKVVVYPAAVNRMKNQLMLIRSFASIAADFPDWELHLYGRMNYAYGVKCVRVARRSKAADRIRFFDFTDDLPSVYAGSAIMAFPSLLEGFPLTVIEGMRFALPPILVDALPGADEMVVDGVTGLIAHSSVKGLASALARMMSDPDLRRRLGEQAKSACESNFSKNRVIDAWEKLLNELLQLKRSETC